MPLLPIPTPVAACDGSVRPGDLVGFNPQPDPPREWFVLIPKLSR